MGSQSAPCIKHWWMNWLDWHDLFLKLIGLFQEPFPDVLVSKCKRQTKNKLLVEASVALDRKSTCYCFMGLNYFSLVYSNGGFTPGYRLITIL